MNNPETKQALFEAFSAGNYRVNNAQPEGSVQERFNVWNDRHQIESNVFTSISAERAQKMRNSANTVFELTKGFNGEPTEPMKTALEMAGYVLYLTNSV